ncbi:hypothetical protein X948_5664 [Burkholderia pseudomallei MSHR5608]|nr:hypothetical protein X948_5664 [Burkholderia pseudomallei MSHR5608]
MRKAPVERPGQRKRYFLTGSIPQHCPARSYSGIASGLCLHLSIVSSAVW